MVGRSPAMQAVFDIIGKASVSEATILLEGETGTGKEVSAEAIHRGSPRRDKPFVVVDCGAMPPNLLESELFGHERGAFTGAVSARRACSKRRPAAPSSSTRSASWRSTCSPSSCACSSGARSAGSAPTTTSRSTCGSSPPPTAACARRWRRSKFRSDLYYRLAVVEVKLPPLRERLPDLPLLVDHTVRNLGAMDEETLTAVRGPQFLAALAHHNWPGNIRELRNYLERCVALRDFAPPRGATASAATPTGPEGAVNIGQPLREAREAWVSSFERRYLEELLRLHDNRVSAAARAAGVDRIYFYRLLWKHGLRTREQSGEPSGDPAP